MLFCTRLGPTVAQGPAPEEQAQPFFSGQYRDSVEVKGATLLVIRFSLPLKSLLIQETHRQTEESIPFFFF